LWAGLSVLWSDWRTALVIVQTATVIAWHISKSTVAFPREQLFEEGHVPTGSPLE
jgi:hypothetical protein